MSERPMHRDPAVFQKLQALYAEGEEAMNAGAFEDAVRCFTDGLGLDDHFRQRWVTMYAQRAFALQKLGRLELAIADFSKALELGEPPPHQAQYFFHRGLCWQNLPTDSAEQRREHVDKAIADYGRSMDLHPEHPGPFHLRGKLLVNECQRFHEGLADLTQALRLTKNADAMVTRGFALYSLGRFGEARAEFEASLEHADAAYTHYMLACVAAKRGDEEALAGQVRLTLKRDPAFHEAFTDDEEFTAFQDLPEFRDALVGKEPPPPDVPVLELSPEAAEAELEFVGTEGGPLLACPDVLTAKWWGVFDEGGEAIYGEQPCDYDRACDCDGLAVPVAEGEALVLGPEASVAFFKRDANTAYLLQWIGADEGSHVLQAALSATDDDWEPRGRFTMTGTRLALFDSAEDGRDLEEPVAGELGEGTWEVDVMREFNGVVLDDGERHEVMAGAYRLRRS